MFKLQKSSILISTFRAIAPLLLFVLLALHPAIGLAQSKSGWNLLEEHPLNGTVWTGAGEASNRDIMMQHAAAARYVLIGENHDNPDHHRQQAEIIVALAASGKRPAIAFEMIPPSFQNALDSFLQQEAPNDSKLGEILEWEERGWPDWEIYKPIATAAIKYGLPMLAGGINRQMVVRISREGPGALPEEERLTYGLETPLPEKDHEALLDEMEQSHCGLMPRSALGYMIPVQRARDGALAAALVKGAAGNDTAVLIAGGGHVRKDRGAPVPLARLDKQADIVTIGLFPVLADKTAFKDYLDDSDTLPFDFVIFTDASEPKDHCAELKARLGKK